MATYEKKGRMTYKDKNGDLYILYPATKKECVDGISEIEDELNALSTSVGETKAQIGSLSDLTTDAKQNIVAAINEMVSKSNGDISEERVSQLIEEYFVENPLPNTPEKGVDYFTEEDKQEMVDAVISSITMYAGEVEDA